MLLVFINGAHGGNHIDVLPRHHASPPYFILYTLYFILCTLYFVPACLFSVLARYASSLSPSANKSQEDIILSLKLALSYMQSARTFSLLRLPPFLKSTSSSLAWLSVSLSCRSMSGSQPASCSFASRCSASCMYTSLSAVPWCIRERCVDRIWPYTVLVAAAGAGCATIAAGQLPPSAPPPHWPQRHAPPLQWLQLHWPHAGHGRGWGWREVA